jgi:hypothetical protein
MDSLQNRMAHQLIGIEWYNLLLLTPCTGRIISSFPATGISRRGRTRAAGSRYCAGILPNG